MCKQVKDILDRYYLLIDLKHKDQDGKPRLLGMMEVWTFQNKGLTKDYLANLLSVNNETVFAYSEKEAVEVLQSNLEKLVFMKRVLITPRKQGEGLSEILNLGVGKDVWKRGYLYAIGLVRISPLNRKSFIAYIIKGKGILIGLIIRKIKKLIFYVKVKDFLLVYGSVERRLEILIEHLSKCEDS